MDTKSRFHGLRLFRINSTSGQHNAHTSQSQPQPSFSLPPPHPPPKDHESNTNFFVYTSPSIGAASTPDLSYNSMRSPSGDYPRFQSPVSPLVQQTSSSSSTSLVSPATALRKSLTKLSSLGRRSNKSTNIPHSPSLNVLPECNDEGISAPYNFQHNIHVNDNLQGMPPSWLSTLLAAGFTEEEIDNLRVARRQRAVTPATTTSIRDYAGPTMATFPVTYSHPTSLTQFGELYSPLPEMNISSQSTRLHHNHNNPSTSISLFSNSIRSSSPSNSRESLSPSPHVTQQSMLSPLYTQHPAGYTPSYNSHQTHSQSDYDEPTIRSHSPTESSSRAPTDAVTYSQQPTSMSYLHTGRRSAVTPPINTHNFHPVMYRVVNEDPTPTTPPPAYASPKSPYRPHEKGLEKAYRWDASSSAQGEGSGGFENTSPVVSQPVAEPSSAYDSPVRSNSLSHDAVHVVDQNLEAEITSSAPACEEPPLLSSDNFDRTVFSASGDIIGEDHREEGGITERTTLSRTSSHADDMSKPAALEKTEEVLVDHNSIESLGEHPPTLAAPPRLSLHTDQDDDWSTILRFSFSGNNVNLRNDNPSIATSQSLSSPLTISSLSMPQKNRGSRRSSIIYGPRGSPCAKEKLYPGLEWGVLHEQEESSSVVVSSPVRHQSSKRENSDDESWADNYLDMKDGDYEDLEDVDMSKRNLSQEKSNTKELCSAPEHESPRDSSDSSLTRQSRSPDTNRRSLPSPSSSQQIFVTTPKAVTPLSPSSPMISPALSPISARRPTSILSRRSFDLPPPLPPPEDDLPPTPGEVAALGLRKTASMKSPSQNTQNMQGSITHVNTRSQHDSQFPQPPVPPPGQPSSQRLLSSLNTNMPAASLPKRDLPPVPLKVNTGVKHVHMPMSSISSAPSHGRSPSGYCSNPASSTIGHPPPLPMPPIGKVLPSVIMQQRRAAAATSDAHLSRNTTINHLSTVAANSNLTPSPSASTFSHSSRSAYSPDTSETDSVSDKQKSSTTHGNLSPVRVTDVSSAMGSQLDEASSSTSAKGASSFERIVDTKDDEEKRTSWSADSKPSEESIRFSGQDIAVSPNTVHTFTDSVVQPPSPSVPLTPLIAVNGLAVTTMRDLIPIQETVPPESLQMRPVPLELPLVLYPIEEYISTNIEPLDKFFELQEIAQGQYGSVYMAQDRSQDGASLAVAIKKVPIPTKGTPKISQLKRELTLMSKVRHRHILETDALFYEPTESMLWIQMALMERSLADILALGEEGLQIQERVIARFASDILSALAYLNEQGIAHRDVRSDNLLMNSDGILKLADLSNAVQVPQTNSIRLDIVGIHHWQAPEIRSGRYDALKIDVWSLGATVWECAEFIPPFSDVEDFNALGVRWPPLSRADEFSKEFHDFLRLCSEPAASRPPPGRLLRHAYVQMACPRVDVLSLLDVCRSMEEAMRNGD